jgi:hypothetical protein
MQHLGFGILPSGRRTPEPTEAGTPNGSGQPCVPDIAPWQKKPNHQIWNSENQELASEVGALPEFLSS